MRSDTSIAALLAITWLLVGCGVGLAPQVRIDGWPVGPPVDCAALRESDRQTGSIDAPGCGRIMKAALGDARLEGLPTARLRALTTEAVIYEMDLIDETTSSIHGARSGGGAEWVIALGPADSRIVVGVWCGAGIHPNQCGLWDAPPW